MIQKKSAFTLIELLVVIVIIGILATIGIAQFNGYQAKARDAKKIVHINQLQKAIELYFIESETYTLPCAGYHAIASDPCQKTNSIGFVGIGNDSLDNSSNYTTSIAKALHDRGYLGGGVYEELTSTKYSRKYMYYNDANTNSYSFSVELENPSKDYAVNGTWYELEGTLNSPSATDIERMDQVYNGSGANGVYTNYGMNYAFGINK